VEVAIGIDPAKSTLAAAGVDPLGKVLGAAGFSNDPGGHQALLGWIRERACDRVIGIECSASYGATLSRLLLCSGEDVREVPTTLTHRQRRRRASQGKSDLVDSVAIARIVASGEVCHRLTGSSCSPISGHWSSTVTSSFGHGHRWPTAPTPIW
jgi:transposase